jgi:hypothetical protein
MISRSGLVYTALLLTSALSWSMLPDVAEAYTPEQEQMCTSDAFRLCSSAIPDVDRVTACMISRKSELSPGCRAFFREPEREAEAAPVRVRKPTSIKPRKAAKPKKPRRAD